MGFESGCGHIRAAAAGAGSVKKKSLKQNDRSASVVFAVPQVLASIYALLSGQGWV